MKHTIQRFVLLLSTSLFFAQCNHQQAHTTTSSKNTVFIWDFSKPKKYIYRYTTTQKHSSFLSDDNADKAAAQTMEATLVVKVKSNQMADLIVANIREKKSILNQKAFGKGFSGAEAQVIYQDYPADGQIQTLKGNLSLGTLFPLPPYDFAKGGSAKSVVKLPFHLYGSTLFANGYHKLYYKERTKKKQRNCAVLTGEWNVSDLKVPEELKADAKLEYKGKGTYFFDYENHCFVYSEVNLRTEMSAEMKGGGIGSLDNVALDSQVKIVLELIKVEEY
ncbi:hypothetical protein [uncultured Microscilla sp.]|uniref:hypothetical protein n=1 Tax=uncultured Microscilla sp. TaxID=432653 RepID=UPI0026055379|nr:hypothetical protein [uncultured Microscilla sp.]